MSTFGPKFLEAQFSLSASEAATLFGYLVVPAGGGGTFLGGFFVNKFKLRGAGIIKLCLLCTLTSLLAFFVFFIHCPNVPMAGVTASHSGSLLPDGHLDLTAPCNADCACRPEHYSPVCGSDGLTYYSPCHAGCPGAAVPSPGGQKDQCGQQGSCFVYQNAAMSRYMLVSGLAYKVLGFLFFTIACLLYKPPSESPDGLGASLPSQSSASDNAMDLPDAPSALQPHSDV